MVNKYGYVVFGIDGHASMMSKEKFIRGYLYGFSFIWIFYSLFVWANPAFLASISGLGLELGMALFALAGAVFPERYLRANVLLWMLVPLELNSESFRVPITREHSGSSKVPRH